LVKGEKSPQPLFAYPLPTIPPFLKGGKGDLEGRILRE